jgi:hypothetical protein
MDLVQPGASVFRVDPLLVRALAIWNSDRICAPLYLATMVHSYLCMVP